MIASKRGGGCFRRAVRVNRVRWARRLGRQTRSNKLQTRFHRAASSSAPYKGPLSSTSGGARALECWLEVFPRPQHDAASAAHPLRQTPPPLLNNAGPPNRYQGWNCFHAQRCTLCQTPLSWIQTGLYGESEPAAASLDNK